MKLRVRFFAESLVTIFVVFLLMVGCEVSDEGIPDFEDDEPVAVRITAEEKQDNADDSVALEQPESSAFVRVGVDILRLRSGPGTDYEILERLIYGTLLKVLDQDNEWLFVELSNWEKTEHGNVARVEREGWVHSDYVIDSVDFIESISSVESYDPNLPFSISYWKPGDYYWLDTGFEFYFYVNNEKLSFDTGVIELYDVLGEPDSIIDHSNGVYEWELCYPLINIRIVGYDNMNINDGFITEVKVSSPNIIGPRGIRVGDSLESLLSKVPNEGNQIAELDNVREWQGKIAYYEKIIYDFNDYSVPSQTSIGPIAYIAYNENKEPLYAYFGDNDHGSFYTGALIVHFEDDRISHYILALSPL